MGILDAMNGAGGLSALTSIFGDVLGMSGQQQNNEFQQQMMLQNEQWQEHMSDTAMQRRVTDLQAAGLNPLLAVNSQGATTGSTSIPMGGNTMAGFGNLGQQMNSAMSLDPDINKTKADTNATNQAAITSAMDTALKGVSLQTLQQAADEDLPHWQAELIRSQAYTEKRKAEGLGYAADIGELDFKAKTELYPLMLQAAKAQYQAAQSSAAAQAKFNTSIWGQIFHSVFGGSSPTSVGSAAGAAASMLP